MKFYWDVDEGKWESFRNSGTDDFLGYCRTGNLCFDIRSWWYDHSGFGFQLFCGGVDSGYGYSGEDAMKTGKYASKMDVPDELLYPYDEVEMGEFPQEFRSLSFDEFKRKAETVFETFINECWGWYNGADLLQKANEPLHIW